MALLQLFQWVCFHRLKRIECFFKPEPRSNGRRLHAICRNHRPQSPEGWCSLLDICGLCHPSGTFSWLLVTFPHHFALQLDRPAVCAVDRRFSDFELLHQIISGDQEPLLVALSSCSYCVLPFRGFVRPRVCPRASAKENVRRPGGRIRAGRSLSRSGRFFVRAPLGCLTGCLLQTRHRMLERYSHSEQANRPLPDNLFFVLFWK